MRLAHCLQPVSLGKPVLAQFSEDVGVGMEIIWEIIWDLLIFLVLVAVGLVVLNLVARAR